jgi:hypothetical protein
MMRFNLIRFATCVLSALAVLAVPSAAGAGIIWMHQAFSGAYHVDAGVWDRSGSWASFDQRDGGVPDAPGLWGGSSVSSLFGGARGDARMVLYSGDGGGEFQFDGDARNASSIPNYIGSANATLSFTAPFTVDASDLFRTDFRLAAFGSQGGSVIEMRLRDDLGVLSQFSLVTQSFRRYDQYESLSALVTAGMTYYLDVNIRMNSWDSNFNTLIMDHFTHQLGSPVPEPTALALLGAGLAGVALRRRRKA